MENTKVFMKRTENIGNEKSQKTAIEYFGMSGGQGDKETRRQGTGDQKGPWLAEIYAEAYVLLNHD